ncbi:hypothetical protein CsSME_00009208 [Camellia sinensis var. sinensis]|uniref:Uncharacterized protein n=1 Tax=Camellia sinensis TaxID=4442 RepID=A0A7J7GR89_CAMSI|nr:hypothetical protein HYC85_017386 [Camellia sinensis]
MGKIILNNYRHFCDLTLPLFNILYVRKNISNEEVTVIYDPASSVLPKTFISLVIITGLVLTMNGQEFTIEEATTREIQQAFADNKLTSRQLVDFYLNGIEELNPVRTLEI